MLLLLINPRSRGCTCLWGRARALPPAGGVEKRGSPGSSGGTGSPQERDRLAAAITALRESSLPGKRPKASLARPPGRIVPASADGRVWSEAPQVVKVKSSGWFSTRDVTEVLSNALGGYAATVGVPGPWVSIPALTKS